MILEPRSSQSMVAQRPALPIARGVEMQRGRLHLPISNGIAEDDTRLGEVDGARVGIASRTDLDLTWES